MFLAGLLFSVGRQGGDEPGERRGRGVTGMSGRKETAVEVYCIK